MALRELEWRANGGWRSVSVKYCVLGSIKKWAILVCQIIFKMKKMTSWYHLDLFTIPLRYEGVFRNPTTFKMELFATSANR